MRYEHDYDEYDMDEGVCTIRVPLMTTPQPVNSARPTQHDLLHDLQKMMQDERIKEEKRIKLLKQKQNKIGQEITKRLAAKDRKIRQLEQQQTKKVFNECTFKPKTSTKGSNRSLEEFLQQQTQFTKKIEQKRMTLKQNLELKKEEKNTFMPKTNNKTQQRKRQGTVFDRLYALKDKQNQDDGNNCRLSEDFQPKITQKGKNLARNGPVDELLYKDALRRQEKAKEVEIQHQSNPLIGSRGLNINNEKYVAQKFIKQYFGVIDKLQVPHNSSSKIDYMLFNEILKQMGFVQVEEESQSSHQRTLIHQAYQFLQNFKVNARNICVFLLALVGVFHINPVNFEQNDQRCPQEELALDEAQGRKVQKNFDLFKRNRLFSQNLRRQAVSQGNSYSFKPQINKSSEEMAQKYRQQMLQEVNQVLELYPQVDFNVPKDGVITPTDLLVMYNKAREIRKQCKKQELSEQQMENCTFKPMTLNQSQTMGASKWSSAEGNLGQKKSFQLYNYHRELQSKKQSLRVSRQCEDPTMKQCTFAPKLSKKKVTSDTSNFNTKQVQETLYRMKKGRQQWESKQKFMQRGQPSGTNKDMKSSSVHEKETSKVQETPILLLDVNLGNRVERLTLFSGDQQRLKEVSREFAMKHELDEQSESRLLELLQIQMQSVLAKIPQDQQSEDNLQQ